MEYFSKCLANVRQIYLLYIIKLIISKTSHQNNTIMQRQAITNGNGQWFNIEKAILYKEETRWNGSNNISKATGSQWHHEYLYYSASGAWILNKWSNYQDSVETYDVISKKEAIEWFLNQSMDLPELLTGEDAPYEI